MRQMIKKTFALILALSMVLSLVPVLGATVIEGTNEKTVYFSFTFSSDDMGADRITQVAQGEMFYAGVNFAGNPTELADSIQAYDLFISYPADKVSFPYGNDCCLNGLTTPLMCNSSFADGVLYAGWASEKGIIESRVIQSSGTLFFIEMQAETALSAEDLNSFSFVDEVDGTSIIVADGRDDLFTIVQAPAMSVGAVSGSVYSDATAEEIKNLIQSFSFVDNACAVNTYTSADSEWAGLEVILPSTGLTVGKNTLIARYGDITCDFEITVLDKVASIAITTPPAKTKYGEFEKFDKTGMVVTATYESGTTADVTADCVVDTTTPLRVTDTSWIVSYGGKTASQPITVTAPRAVINITAPAIATRGKEVLVTFTFDHTANADIGRASANFVYSAGFPPIITENTKITQNTAGWSNAYTTINKDVFVGMAETISGGTIVGQLAFRIPDTAAFGTVYTVSLDGIVISDSNGEELSASEYSVLNSSASVEVVYLPRVEGISVTDYSGTYDGAEHTVSVEIPEGATIKYSADGTAGSYTLDAPAKFKDAGEHKAYYVVSKEGNSDTYGYGNVSIQAKSLSDGMIAAISPKMYTGSQIMPPVTVTDGSPSIITTDDYTVSYGANVNVSDGGSVTITGKGNYKGTATARFDILPITMAVEEVNYNGKYDGAAHSAQVNAKTPAAATVTYGTSAGTYNLTAMPEYTNVGTYTVYYKATAANYEDYTGSVKVVITPKTLTPAMVADIPAFDYTGSKITPIVTVTDDALGIISPEVDYIVSYGANVNVADGGSVTVTGIGNYEGAVTKVFVINKIAMTVSSSDYTGVYDGAFHSGTVNVQIPGGATVMYGLSDGVYTDAVMPEFKDAGTNTVYFKATDPNYLDYTGSFNVSITPKSVEDVTIADIPDMPYTGRQITPSVTVTDGALGVITFGEDYTVSYGTNVNVADGGSVTITGQGNYTGEATKTFNITPIEMIVAVSGYTGTYDGAAHSGAVNVVKPENGATVVYGTTSGTYNLAEMPTYTDAGRYTVYYKATAANYIDNTGSVEIVIRPAEVTPASAVVADKVYNGASDDAVVTGVEFTGLFGTDALVKDTDYEVVSAVYGDKNVSETAPVTVTVALKNTVKNYVLATNTVSATGKITKATSPALTAATAQTLLSSSIVSGAKEYSFNLAGIISGIPTDAGTVTYAVKEEGAYVAKVGTGIDGSSLKVNVAEPKTAGTTDTVVITVSSANYADADVTVNFEFKDKTPVTVTVDDVNTTYGEEYTVAGRYENQPTTGATWTYEYVGIEGTDYPATDVKPTKAGRYQVIARYEDNVVENDVPGHVGEDIATLTIARKNLTLADGDVAVTKVYDGTTAAGTLTGILEISSGVVNIDDVSVNMTYASATAYENANVGTYSVTISGYVLGGADKDNYNIPETYTFNRATITKQLQSTVTINGATDNITATYGDEMNLTVGGGNGEGAYALVSSDSSILRLNAVNATTWEAEILKAGTVTLTATRQGDANYEDATATEISFVINRKAIADTDFTFDLDDKVFTGSEIKPEVTSTLTSADYEVVYANNTNVGTATITVTGTGNYEETITKPFEITRKTLNDTEFTVTGIQESYEYTGTEIKPEVGVKWGSINLVKDTDYEVAYETNTNVGTATVTLTGKGNYDGTVTKTFEITPKQYTGTVEITANTATVELGTVLTANAPAGGTLSYQWKRNGEDITDATADTYTVTTGDAGADITVAVTSTGNYTGTLTSAAVTVGKAVLTGTVTIAGTTDITATIENAPSAENYEIVWLRDGAEIPNVTETTYTVTSADKGCVITVKLVAVGDTYTGEIISNAIAVPAEAPSFVQNPTATAGNASITVGFVVNANGSAVRNYKIYVDGSEVATLTGDQTSYLITGLTNGTTYTVTVEAINEIGSTVSAPVTATPVVYSGGGGGGAAAPAKYTIKFVTNGGTSIDDVKVEKNDKLPSVAAPEKEGYTFDGWFTDSALTKPFDADTAIIKSLTLYAKWTEKTDDGKEEEPNDKPEVPEFTDVKPTAYFYDAVKWAVENNVTSGTGANEFSPDDECTRAQMVTFLWRAAGSPKADNTNNPFGDVSSDKYYYDAVVWALENGITSGISATEFEPNGKVSRAQSVTFLWRLAGAISGDNENPFSDVSGSAYYGDAVAWAVANNVTYGLTATSFGPNDVCTRAQIVTFIFRHFVK